MHVFCTDEKYIVVVEDSFPEERDEFESFIRRRIKKLKEEGILISEFQYTEQELSELLSKVEAGGYIGLTKRGNIKLIHEDTQDILEGLETQALREE